MTKPINVVDIEFAWVQATIEAMELFVSKYAELETIGASNLIEGLKRVQDSPTLSRQYVESFLRLVATYAKSLSFSEPLFDAILEWTDKPLNDIGYQSRVIYANALESLDGIFLRHFH